MLRRTVLGRNMYATGGNPEVARLVGINTDLYKIGAFVLIGMLAAIAGMFVMADLASGTTSIGSGWELTVIAGVVVGGVSLFGGAGTLAGGIVGVLLLQVVTSGLVVIGVSSNWQQIAVGVIMVLAVGLDIVRRRYFIAGAGPPQAPRRMQRPAKPDCRRIRETWRGDPMPDEAPELIRAVLGALARGGAPAGSGRRSLAPRKRRCSGCSRCATIRCTG